MHLISTILNNKLCHLFESERLGVLKLKKNLFTNAAIDNTDHNPISITDKDFFHGTYMSLFQHPQSDTSGLHHPTVDTLINSSPSNIILLKLLQSYTDVPPVTLCKKYPIPPKVEGPNTPDCVFYT